MGELIPYAVSKTVTDSLNDIIDTGIYNIDKTATETPDLSLGGNSNVDQWCLVVMKPLDGSSVIQFMFTGFGDVFFRRNRVYSPEGNVWNTWVKRVFKSE